MANPLRSYENRFAQRFPLNVQVTMKSSDDDQEIAYATRDISYRGVFVYTDQPLPEDSPVQFTMKLQSPSAPDEGIQVLCIGKVVRVESPGDGNTGMAATIDSYRFLHQNQGNA